VVFLAVVFFAAVFLAEVFFLVVFFGAASSAVLRFDAAGLRGLPAVSFRTRRTVCFVAGRSGNAASSSDRPTTTEI
jgi:hypothetical protein